LAPEIQEDQGGPIRGKGLRSNIIVMDKNNKEGKGLMGRWWWAIQCDAQDLIIAFFVLFALAFVYLMGF
jgi:hypothetical protein